MSIEKFIAENAFVAEKAPHSLAEVVLASELREFMQGKVVVGATPIGWVFRTPAGRFRDAFVEGHVKPDERASWTPVYLQPTTSEEKA